MFLLLLCLSSTGQAQAPLAEPNNGPAWTNLGESRMLQRKFDEAIAAFSRAESIKYRPFLNVVNQARAYAEKQDDPKVLQLIQRVIDGGVGAALWPYIQRSTEFQRFAEDPRWKALEARMKPGSAPEFRQFDFWVGDWDVCGTRWGRAR